MCEEVMTGSRLLAIRALSSAKSPTRIVGSVGWLDMKMLNKRGAVTATPALIGFGGEIDKPYRTEKNRSSRYDLSIR